MRITFKENEGLPVRANLYVIRCIYYEMKKDRAHIFNEKNEEGKKSKAIPIYSKDFFPISRQRLDRINHGEAFQFSKGEAEKMTSCYGIQTKYFIKDKATFFKIQKFNETVLSSMDNEKIEYIDELSWKCFYLKKYNVDYALNDQIGKTVTQTEYEQRAKDVEYSLKNLTLNWRSLKTNNPLYAICYYFHSGVCIGKDLANIEQLEECLQVIEVRAWDKMKLETVERIFKSMKEHCEYMETLVKLYALRKKYQ